MASERTLVEYFNDHEGHKCGYCGSKTTSYNRGMWAHSLDVVDYQGLIDRGWRRSGQYCYKPSMSVTCCPLYGIRCQVNNFRPSKSQKKVIKRMRQFLVNGGQKDIDDWKQKCEKRKSHNSPAEDDDEMLDNLQLQNNSSNTTETIASMQSVEEKVAKAPIKGPDPEKPLQKKAKQLRLERRREKLLKKGKAPDEVKSKPEAQEKSLEELLPHLNPPENAKHKLEIKLVQSCPQSQEFLKNKKDSYEVYKKYQMTIHGDSPHDCPDKQWGRFLVDSPLHADDRLFKPGFGSFHNQYWIDDELIAVGVVDILSNYVSSVYFYYNPDYGFLSLGVYSALSELVLTRRLNALCPSIEYYCMGYFNEGCQKMRYKEKFAGSELLCPFTYKWVPVLKCIPTLQKTKYARLNVLNGGSPDEKDSDGEWENLDEVLCLYGRRPTRYVDYQHNKFITRRQDDLRPPTEAEVKQKMALEDEKIWVYAKMVGKKCGTRMLLFRSESEDYY